MKIKNIKNLRESYIDPFVNGIRNLSLKLLIPAISLPYFAFSQNSNTSNLFSQDTIANYKKGDTTITVIDRMKIINLEEILKNNSGDTLKYKYAKELNTQKEDDFKKIENKQDTIWVTEGDPRLEMYNDSLCLFQKSLEAVKNIEPNAVHVEKDSNNNLKLVLKNFTNKNVRYHHYAHYYVDPTNKWLPYEKFNKTPYTCCWVPRSLQELKESPEPSEFKPKKVNCTNTTKRIYQWNFCRNGTISESFPGNPSFWHDIIKPKSVLFNVEGECKLPLALIYEPPKTIFAIYPNISMPPMLIIGFKQLKTELLPFSPQPINAPIWNNKLISQTEYISGDTIFIKDYIIQDNDIINLFIDGKDFGEKRIKNKGETIILPSDWKEVSFEVVDEGKIEPCTLSVKTENEIKTIKGKVGQVMLLRNKNN